MSGTRAKIERYAPTLELAKIALAVEAMLRAEGYPDTDAFFNEEEIGVCGYLNNWCVEINIRNEPYGEVAAALKKEPTP